MPKFCLMNLNYIILSGYIQIHTPILTSNDCEGGGEVFNIDTKHNKVVNETKEITKAEKVNDEYFDKQVYLTVSGQLHLEAICNGISKVIC